MNNSQFYSLDKIINLGIYLLVVLIPVQIYFNIYKNLSLSIAQVLVGILLLLCAGTLYYRRTDSLLFENEIDWAVGLLVLVFLTSIFVAADKVTSLKYFVKWSSSIALYFIVSKSIRNIDVLKKALFIFFVTAGIVAAIGIYEHYQGFTRVFEWLGNSSIAPIIMEPDTLKKKLATDSFNYAVQRWPDITKSGIRAFGTFECAIAFSAYLGLIFPFLPWLLSFTRKYFAWTLILFAVLITTLTLNFTRSAYIGFALTVAFSMYFLINKFNVSLRYILTGLIAGVIFISAIIVPSKDTIETLKIRFSRPPAEESSRRVLWGHALKVWRHRPFLGTGLANYDVGIKEAVPGTFPIVPAHNEYLQIAAETGTIGILVYIALLFIGLRCSLEMLKKMPGAEQKYIAMGFLGMWIWYSVQSFFDTYLFGDKFAMMFWLMVGLNSALYEMYKKEAIILMA